MRSLLLCALLASCSPGEEGEVPVETESAVEAREAGAASYKRGVEAHGESTFVRHRTSDLLALSRGRNQRERIVLGSDDADLLANGGLSCMIRIHDGHLLCISETHGVLLDLDDFPGETVVLLTEGTDLPQALDLPDGTRLVFHGSSFVLGGKTYELSPEPGVAEYVHPGRLIFPRR